uniref:Collagen alpha-1(XII) chain-like n=1 Tax=Phascolarctos cinereus TaxID=38626 RepID=A0A6P5LP94_PHACI|nr:collagen alpha-1(XII) chain-like [Phascolarctos cinereus]
MRPWPQTTGERGGELKKGMPPFQPPSIPSALRDPGRGNFLGPSPQRLRNAGEGAHTEGREPCFSAFCSPLHLALSLGLGAGSPSGGPSTGPSSLPPRAPRVQAPSGTRASSGASLLLSSGRIETSSPAAPSAPQPVGDPRARAPPSRGSLPPGPALRPQNRGLNGRPGGPFGAAG